MGVGLDIPPICIMATVRITQDNIEDISTWGIQTNLGLLYFPAIKLKPGTVTSEDRCSWANDEYVTGFHYKASHMNSHRTGDVLIGYTTHCITQTDEPTFIIFNKSSGSPYNVSQRIYCTTGTQSGAERFYGYIETYNNDTQQWEREDTPAWSSSMIGYGGPHFAMVYDDAGYRQFALGGSYIANYADNDPSSSQSTQDVTEIFKPKPGIPGQLTGGPGQLAINFNAANPYNLNYENSKSIADASVEVTPDPEVPSDPYNKGGSTSGGGGTGTFSRTGDNIAIPALPTLSAVDAGFITIFNPSISQLRSLAAYMWSDAFSIDTFKKIFADPMDCILGMSIVPVNVPNGASKEVKVGNIGTGVSMTTAATQYVSVDCGTLNVEEYWGAYLDYDPYTKAEIYLPYIGTHPVAIDDIMGKSVHVVYHIDILSGACIAFIQCGGTVIYSFAGQCASSIPITGNDWTNVINGVLQIAGSIGSMVASGGISAPMSIANIASTAVNSAKPQVEKSGSISGTGGMLGVQTPYLIITFPRQAVPYRQNAFKGYPSNVTVSLGSLSGFTVVDSIHLENVPATGEELNEIVTLLREGVIL